MIRSAVGLYSFKSWCSPNMRKLSRDYLCQLMKLESLSLGVTELLHVRSVIVWGRMQRTYIQNRYRTERRLLPQPLREGHVVRSRCSYWSDKFLQKLIRPCQFRISLTYTTPSWHHSHMKSSKWSSVRPNMLDSGSSALQKCPEYSPTKIFQHRCKSLQKNEGEYMYIYINLWPRRTVGNK